MSSAIDDGFTVCIWNDRRVANYKDINEMVLAGLSTDVIVDIITSNAYSGLSAKQNYRSIKI